MKIADLNQEVLLKIKEILDNAIPHQEERYFQNIEEVLKNPLFLPKLPDEPIHVNEIQDLYNKFSIELDRLVQKGDYPRSLQEETLKAFSSSASLDKDSPSRLDKDLPPRKETDSAPLPLYTSKHHHHSAHTKDFDDNHLDEINEQIDCLEKQGLYDDVPFQCQNELKNIALFFIESGGESRSLSTDIYNLLRDKGKMPEKKANDLARAKDNLFWNEVRVVCPKKNIPR